MKKLISIIVSMITAVTCCNSVFASEPELYGKYNSETHFLNKDDWRCWYYYFDSNPNEVYIEAGENVKNNIFAIPESINEKKVVGYHLTTTAVGKVKYSKSYKLIIPKTLLYFLEPNHSLGSWFTYSTFIREYEVDPDNPNFTTQNGVLYTKDMTGLVRYPSQSKAKKYIMPNTVKQIEQKDSVYYPYTDFCERITFSYCKYLKEVQINDKIKNIMRHEFYECSQLKKVKLGKGIKTIYSSAFENCKNLSKVTFQNQKKSPKIYDGAFTKTKKGIKFYVKNKKVAKSLKKQLKGSGVKKAKIYVGKTLIYKNVK